MKPFQPASESGESDLHDAPGPRIHPENRRGAGQEEELVFLCGHYEGIDERLWS